MKFSCVKENLEKVLTQAERFTGKNITLPVLGNFLLESDGNTLRVTATNLEYAIQADVPGRGLTPGKVSVPAKVLSALVQSIKDEKVEIEDKQGNLLVRTDTRDVKINGVSSEDFPLIPKIKKTAAINLEMNSLQGGILKVLPAVSASEFKPELTGVLFRLSGRTLDLAATDTFRLAQMTLETSSKKNEGGDSLNFILPQRVAQEIARISSVEEEMQIAIGENQALFETGGVKIISRLIEGNFPEYGGIIPKDFKATAYLNRGELIGAIRSSSIFASKIQEVNLNFVSGKKLEITSSNPEVGEQKTALAISGGGEELKVSFNYRYLLDGLNALDDEEVFLGCNADNAPALLKNKSGGSFLYVLMPIRIS